MDLKDMRTFYEEWSAVMNRQPVADDLQDAIRTALSMKRQDLTRADVAARMGCSPQYVSRLLKGQENLSLETICKLENALQEPIMEAAFA